MIEPPASHRHLLDQPLFAHLATARPDGAPQTNPMWFLYEEGRILMTHTRERQKFRNLERDARFALSIVDPANPYSYLEVRGVLESTEPDPAGHLYDRLAERYGAPWRVTDAPVRVILRFRPERFLAR